MGDKHPYVSAVGTLVEVLDHLKKSFPGTLDADVLRKLGFAPSNESYIINTIRFLKLIDDKGTRTEQGQKTFTLHDNGAFSTAFSALVKSAYGDLFKLHGEAAWNLSRGKLITYFRQTDQSSELVGIRQANTFRTLATYAGQLTAPASAPSAKNKTVPKTRAKAQSKSTASHGGNANSPASLASDGKGGQRDIGLTVRIEVNLPPASDQDTYDKIFRSIRNNLLNV